MSQSKPSRTLWLLIVQGTVMLAIFAVLTKLSGAFEYSQPQVCRPLKLVLTLFAASFGCYLIALSRALRTESKYLLHVIVAFAVLFRLVMLVSVPIQEIDIYRYIWDGNVTLAGVSPFSYAPQQVIESNRSEAHEELAALGELRDSSIAKQTVLERIHYGSVPTVYPPVSQAVFAAAAATTPKQASFETHVNIMKVWIVAFDVLTILLIYWTLKLADAHVGWLVAYAWCPLVMKEFANSGHLDSIAVCFSVAAVVCVMRANYGHAVLNQKRQLGLQLIGSVMLALAIGAKLYPVVLTPLVLLTAWKKSGWRQALFAATVLGATTLCVLSPLIRSTNDQASMTAETTDPQEGLKVFLSHWMMNDFIFLNLAENTVPDRLRGEGEPRPWFVVVPDSVRETITRLTSELFGVDEHRAAFCFARTTTAVIFGVLALYFAWRASQANTNADWLRWVFLTLAWFWLLLPTLNPWYWIWAMPWICFARSRVWLLMSGLLFLYYLRFFLDAHFVDQRVWLTVPLSGAAFFDYVVVWFEYLPWFVLLGMDHFLQMLRRQRLMGTTYEIRAIQQ